MLVNRVTYVIGALPMFFCNLVSAQADPVEAFRISTELDMRRVDNANLQADSADAVSELQTEASLLMSGRLQGRIADFKTDYAFNSRHYSEFSSRDEQLLLGESSLVLGPEHRRHYLLLSHSSNEILLDPAESDLPENRENRTVLHLGGFTSLRLGSPNRLSLQAGATEIQFDEVTQNEASRLSLAANFVRLVSPLHQMGVNVAGYHLDYRDETESDLDYAQVALSWQGKLQYTQYSIEFGYNTMEQEETGERVDTPLLNLQWSYRAASQGVVFSAAQRLSDTSQGAGSADGFDTPVGVDGRVDRVDQFKLTDLGVAWRHDRPCDRCSVDVELRVQEEDYYTFTELSSREIDFGLRAGYRLTAAVTLEFATVLGDFSALEQEEGDYTRTRVSLAAVFPKAVRNGAISVFAGVNKREYEVQEGYSSAYIGASFKYVLLSR